MGWVMVRLGNIIVELLVPTFVVEPSNESWLLSIRTRLVFLIWISSRPAPDPIVVSSHILINESVLFAIRFTWFHSVPDGFMVT